VTEPEKQRLVDGIKRVIERADKNDLNGAGMRVARVPLRTLRQWIDKLEAASTP
jgi:hypothetical protein